MYRLINTLTGELCGEIKASVDIGSSTNTFLTDNGYHHSVGLTAIYQDLSETDKTSLITTDRQGVSQQFDFTQYNFDLT